MALPRLAIARFLASIAMFGILLLVPTNTTAETSEDVNADGLVGDATAPTGVPCPDGAGSPGFMLAVGWLGNALRINGESGGAFPLGNTGFVSLNSLARSNRGEFYTAQSHFNLPDDEQLLITIDPQTGDATVVTVLDLEGVPDVSIRGMAFSPEGELYAPGFILSSHDI